MSSVEVENGHFRNLEVIVIVETERLEWKKQNFRPCVETYIFNLKSAQKTEQSGS